MLQDISPEQRRKRIEGVVKILILAVTGFLVAPFIFLAIKGLIGLVLAGVVGIVIVQFAPVVAAMIANWRLKMLKAEAARNPIETLQNDFGRRMEALRKFREAITTFSAEVQNFADKLVGFKRQYPDEANRFDEQLQKMHRLLDLRKRKYQEAQESLQAYSLEIDKAKAIWGMGQAAAAMNKAAGMTEDDFLARIMNETALEAVQTGMNTAFADLEISLLDEDRGRAEQLYAAKYQGASLPALPESQSNVVDAVHSVQSAGPRLTIKDVDIQPLDVRTLVRTGG